MNANDVIISVFDALDQLQIPFMLVGSYSSNYYGLAHATQDADIVIQLEQRSVSEFAKILGPDFRLDPQMSFETVTSTYRYNLVHTGSAFKIELFLLSDDPHDQQCFARRRSAPFGPRSAFLPSPENVIIFKLRWSKGGKRTKDTDDVRNVLAVQGNTLDLAYIRDWCDQYGTRQLFEQLWTENIQQ